MAIEAAISLWIAETNQAYVDGGVTQRIVPVAVQDVQYSEAGKPRFESLGHLSGASDGYMDEVHAVRDRTGADLVHLIALETNGCGIVERPGAFGITCDDALTFAHELGHNMGLSHDRYVTNGEQLAYSYGYVNQRAFEDDAPEWARWRTIMAYGTQCRDAGVRCDRVLRFSNPNRTYFGDPLGVPGEDRLSGMTGPVDAARTLNISRRSVEAFRDRASGDQSPSHSNSSSGSLARQRAAPRPVVSAGAVFSTSAPLTRGFGPRRAVGSSNPATLRWREVSVDTGMLARAAVSETATVTLNLFEDTVLTGTMERRTPTSSGGVALFGRLAGIEEGTVTLVVRGNVVLGTVRIPGSTYRIRPSGPQRHTIVQIDPSRFTLQCRTD